MDDLSNRLVKTFREYLKTLNGVVSKTNKHLALAEKVRAASSDMVGSQILSKYEELEWTMKVWVTDHREPSRTISYLWPEELAGLLAKRTMNVIHFLGFLDEEYPKPPDILLGYLRGYREKR